MNNNDPNNSNEKIDAFELLEIIWQNKWLVAIIIGTFFVVGLAYNYIVSNSNFGKNDTTINILIEETPINPSSNTNFFSENTIVELLNLKISSSYNYERWSDTTNSSVYLSQKSANLLKVLKENKVVELGNRPKKTIEAIIAYLTYSTELVSNNIIKQIQTIINNKQRAQQKEMETELLIVANAIQDKTAEIQAAESQLEFINTSIAEGTKDKVEVVVRRLDLLNIITKNQLTIENLKKTKEALALIELHEFNNIQTNLSSNLVRVGKTLNNLRYLYKPSIPLISIIAILAGLILGSLIGTYKQEYIRHKKNKSN